MPFSFNPVRSASFCTDTKTFSGEGKEALRSVPLNDSALDVLKQLNTDTDGFEFLFRSRLEGRFTTISKAFNRIRKLAGLSFLNLHLLRHQHASFLVNSWRTIYEVKQLLGHADIKTTERYSHLSSKTLQAASDCASDMIQNAMQVEVSENVQVSEWCITTEMFGLGFSLSRAYSPIFFRLDLQPEWYIPFHCYSQFLWTTCLAMNEL
jgi:hypothetical protein